MIHAVAIDCEFTSFDRIGGDLIAASMVEIMDDFTLGREIEVFCKPRGTKYFTEKAQEVHGISYFKAQTFPDPEISMKEMLHWLHPLIDQFPLKTVFWGSYNFDLAWIEKTMRDSGFYSSFAKAFHLDKNEHINALKMARQMLKHMPMPVNGSDKDKKKGQYKLDNVARFYGLDHNHHEALSDARVTAQIYCKMMKGENVWTGELL